MMVPHAELIHVKKTLSKWENEDPRLESPRHQIRWGLIKKMAQKYEEDPRKGFVLLELCFPKIPSELESHNALN